jgi:cytidylate kinase
MTSRGAAVDVPVITVDGPGGSGKGTIALRLASRLGWHFLDSGALYRLVAAAARSRGIDFGDEAAVAEVARDLDVEFRQRGEDVRPHLDGHDVGDEIRLDDISRGASLVAALPAVRAALVDRQRAFRRPPGLVADGRDMGTVICPDAALKIYLTASAEERAKRRYKQLKAKGESVNLSRLFREIEARDARDASREVAPLRPADDAVIIDSTDLGINEVLAEVYKLVEERHIVT